MQPRLRKIAKYIALPAMILSSSVAFQAQTLVTRNQDKGTLDQSTVSRTSAGVFTSPEEAGAGSSFVPGAASTTPLAHSSKGVSMLEQAKEISREAI